MIKNTIIIKSFKLIKMISNTFMEILKRGFPNRINMILSNIILETSIHKIKIIILGKWRDGLEWWWFYSCWLEVLFYIYWIWLVIWWLANLHSIDIILEIIGGLLRFIFLSFILLAILFFNAIGELMELIFVTIC